MSKKRDYTRYSKEHAAPVESGVEEVVESAVEASPESVKKFETGIVTDCLRLNVREEPDGTARIVGEVHSEDDVIVDMEKSTDEFYKVITAAGLEGFCMKRYITIMP